MIFNIVNRNHRWPHTTSSSSLLTTIAWFVLGACRWYVAYWTNWGLTCLYYDMLFGWGDWTMMIENTRLMLCISSVGGLWITFVKRRLAIQGYFPVDLVIEGVPMLFLVDVMTHQIPFLLFTIRHPSSSLHLVGNNKAYPSSYMVCHVLLILYCYCHDPVTKYGTSWKTMFYGLLICHILNSIMIGKLI